jgi:hypothetical protein
VRDLVARWHAAVEGNDIWTVEAAFSFAFLESAENENGGGDLNFDAIQRARDLNILKPDLAWLLLDQIAESMADADADRVINAIDDQLDEEFGDLERELLEAAQYRQLAVLKRRILVAKGEGEMARFMKENPGAYQARVAAAAKEWDVPL